MTECIQSRLAFASEGNRDQVAEFNGGTISSDGGTLLLRETDRKIKVLERFSQCFLDGRNPALIELAVFSISTVYAKQVLAFSKPLNQ